MNCCTEELAAIFAGVLGDILTYSNKKANEDLSNKALCCSLTITMLFEFHD